MPMQLVDSVQIPTTTARQTMQKLTLAAITLLGAGLVIPAQRRAKPAQPTDAKSVIQQAMEALGQGRYGTCLGLLEKAQGTITQLWRKAVLAAFPKLDGWKFKDKDTSGNAAAAAMLGLGGLPSRNISRTYTGPGGKRFEFQVHLKAPQVKMLKMMFGNPAFKPKGAELIEYDGYKGFLKKEGSAYSLELVFGDEHYMKGKGWKMTGDEVLGVMSQKRVDTVIDAAKK